MEPYESNKEYYNIVADYTKGTDSEWDSSDQERAKNFKKHMGLAQTVTDSDDNNTTETVTTDSEEVAKHALDYLKKVETG
jgi:hypothetical protein